ncbi:MAG TPA: ABC transporter ATP-binding protein [Dongiaceae bacterium]|nr:ABC transporter ATP-binding protein [Dongiaceae bacterium]
MSVPSSVEASPLLVMQGIAKSFGAVKACHDISLAVGRGDILGLLGENGAGKTTLMNILFGTYAADAGTITIEGRPVEIRNSADALALGIGMVHQHFHLVPKHTVLENLLVGRPGPNGKLSERTVIGKLDELRRDFHLDLDPRALVSSLSIGEQQRVEIAKALIRGARLLVLDEPTATLTPHEAQGLFRALKAMTARGLGVIFISHKLGEVLELTSRVTIMRHGQVVAERVNDGNLGKAELARLMCGRELSPPQKPFLAPGKELLRLDHVATEAGQINLQDVSLTLRAGEIVGIAGVSGNGQRELADLVGGVLSVHAGQLSVNGTPVPAASARIMQSLRIGRVPEDRLAVGMISSLSLADSMALPWIDRAPFSRRGVIDRGAIRRFAESQIKGFDIRTSGPEARTGTLSGGNLQKALLARELAMDPVLLVAAQPTRGIDIGASEFVHQQLLDLRARGGAVLLISEDLEELFALSDRIAVMYGGRVMADLPIAEASVERVGLLMAGIGEDGKATIPPQAAQIGGDA